MSRGNRSTTRLLTLGGAALLAVSGFAAAGAQAPPAAERSGATASGDHGRWMEVFSPDGTIARERVAHPMAADPPDARRVAAAAVEPIEVNGPSENHYDIVFVGDGYTEADLPTYTEHVRARYDELMSIEPFASNRERFNAWQVNVVSPESGVDNDPDKGTERDTALNMGFWCGDTERLLCVDTAAAREYAAQAQDVDQIMAVGNSTKYGGAGYNQDDIATVSGGNDQAGQIAIHEFGHSIAGLGDEYDYSNGATYTGPERAEPNLSILTADQMSQQQAKWFGYLDQPTPDGGNIGTFEGGGGDFSHGIYRPSEDSMMRSLGKQFNSVSRDALVAAFNTEP